MARQVFPPVKIPWLEFQQRIAALAPDCKAQILAPAPYVHVFDAKWLQEDFWPVWCGVKRELNEAVPVRPMENNSRRGICDEITKRFIAELTLSTRIKYGDEDVAPGALEASILIQEEPLNFVSCGAHRTAILAITKDGQTWNPAFVEPQLFYAQFQTTTLDDALARGVLLVERWL